jgi:hypothetical protein
MNQKPPRYQIFLDELKEVADRPAPAAPGVLLRAKPAERLGTQVEEERVRRERIENDNKEKDQRLKEMTLKRLFLFLGIETGVVFIVAFFQAFHFLGFRLDEWSLRLLLAATLVQTVSMLTIAIKHLFPHK